MTPNDVTVRRYLAANLWQLYRYAEAKQNLETVLKERPDDKPTRLLLGMVFENMKAAQMLASVPEQVGQQPESIGALARSYYHLGQTAEPRPRWQSSHGSHASPGIVGFEILLLKLGPTGPGARLGYFKGRTPVA